MHSITILHFKAFTHELPVTVNLTASPYTFHTALPSTGLPSAAAVSSNAACRIHYGETFKPAAAAHLHHPSSHILKQAPRHPPL